MSKPQQQYESYVSRKLALVPPVGIHPPAEIGIPFMQHQDALTKWALRRGRAAIFADTGLGKSRMEIGWAKSIAEHTGRSVLILAPLAVAAQTVAEGASFGVDVNLMRDDSDARDGINIINYDRLHRIDHERFAGVVLDESSVIKNFNSRTLSDLLAAFGRTPYRLCASATPAPNDWTEFGTHAEFLGVCSRAEMLSEYFVHDAAKTQDWRLKRHARHQFWNWVASWGAMVRKPSDLGFDDGPYNLPPLHVHEHTVRSCDAIANAQGFLFPVEAGGLAERRAARKHSISDRVRVAADLANSKKSPWVIWCDLNDESDALCQAIPDAVEIRGSDDAEVKERRLMDFAAGKIRVLVSKPSICGWGLNWQHCCDMAFVGVTDSYEAYYQAVRRCWRFGQKQPVHAHLIASEAEGSVVANIKRKEADAKAMGDALSAETNAAVREAILGSQRTSNAYRANKQISVPSWLAQEAA